MTTPKQGDQYISVVSGTPRLATLPDLSAGSRETASAPPPSAPDAALPPPGASEADCLAYKLAWQAQECQTRTPGPDQIGSIAPADTQPGRT